MTTFSERVLGIAEGIPSGRVIPYWKLAKHAGHNSPASAAGAAAAAIHRAREEGNHRVPWWRTVSYLGRITLSGKDGEAQAHRLSVEGIDLDERRRVPNRHFWCPLKSDV